MVEGVTAVTIVVELKEVVDSSLVGRMLASKASRDAQQDNFRTVVKEAVDGLPTDGLSPWILAENKAACLLDVQADGCQCNRDSQSQRV